MGGFNYGGYGDGTNWSSERGTLPPAGGATGNTGNHDTGGSSNSSGQATAEQQQIDSIRNNAAVRKALTNLISSAYSMNPYAKLTIQSISKTGVMSISVTELSVVQASKIGLKGLIMGFDISGTKMAIGDFSTGISRITTNKPTEHSSTPTAVEKVTTNSTDLFTHDAKSGTYTSTKYFDNAGTIKSLTINGPYTYKIYLDAFPNQVIDVTVNNGDPNNISVTLNNWKGPQDNTKSGVRKLIKEFINFKLNEGKNLLVQASDIIISAGRGISKPLGDKYKTLAGEIAANIKNFQGKKIRSIDAAMISLNKVLSNPKMKINEGDKAALINAWNHLNATDMAYKYGFLGKAFAAADIVMKIEKIRTKTIEATKTGNWKPVLLEVESWVLSGMAAGFALSIVGSLSILLAATTGLPLTVLTVLGIVGITLAASLIDDKLADKINNWLISPAY
ncbi:colicin-like pore-forming protein [Buttiauxella noackiae]|uniref:colicin-like pore-forming protein n=1 Tax=Buttiauxella noackiae TaxID=82992 RepID=UPI0035A708B7